VAKGFRPVLRDQPMLLPVDMREWLPEDHLAWFVLETVDVLDTSGLERCRRVGAAGRAGYDPRMLFALLVYAYCLGVRSSRAVERLCTTDVAFRVLCAQDPPDHTTIARFRAEAGPAFAGLFTQVLLVAARAGLARFGTVAIDGTKIAANASIDANRGGDWLAQQVAAMVTEAEQVDAAEDTAEDAGDGTAVSDRVPGSGGSGRQERVRAAAEQVRRELARREAVGHAAVEGALARRRRSEAGEPVRGRIPMGPHHLAEAQAHLAREIGIHQAKLDRYTGLLAAGRKPMGRPPVPIETSVRVVRARRVVEAAEAAAAAPLPDRTAAARLPSVVANTTDVQSRIMPTRKGFLQGYNAQLAVTSDHLIAAVAVSQSTTDQSLLLPMMHAAELAAARCHAVSGDDRAHQIGTVLADAGYASDANLAAAGPERLIALAKRRDQAKAATTEPASGPPPAGCTPRQAMDHRLRTREGAALYKRRGATVEPVIGNVKRILDRFARRGLDAAASELHLAGMAHNLNRIHRAAPA
jgi:transposase